MTPRVALDELLRERAEALVFPVPLPVRTVLVVADVLGNAAATARAIDVALDVWKLNREPCHR